MSDVIVRKYKRKSTPSTTPIIAKFLDGLVARAAQSEQDIPQVYRDVCIELLSALSPQDLKKKLTELAATYQQPMPEIKLPAWEEDIPF